MEWLIRAYPWPQVQSLQQHCFDSTRIKFYIFDCLISILFTGPLFLGFWRGIWGVTDYFCTYIDHFHSLWITAAGGGLILFLITLLQNKHCNFSIGRENQVFIYQANIFIWAVVDIVYWRGIWYTSDFYFRHSPWTVASVVLVTHILLWRLKWQRGVITSPLILDHDFGAAGYHATVAVLDTKSSETPQKVSNQIWDALLDTVLFEGLNILVWWGPWTLLDMIFGTLFLQSTAIGTLLCLFLMFSRFPLAKLVGRIDNKLIQHLIENTWFLIGNLGVIFYWRGIWGLWDSYFLSSLEDPWPKPWPLISCSLSASLGFVFISVLGQTQTFVAKDQHDDGELEGGSGMSLNISFIQPFMNSLRKKPIVEPVAV